MSGGGEEFLDEKLVARTIELNKDEVSVCRAVPRNGTPILFSLFVSATASPNLTTTPPTPSQPQPMEDALDDMALDEDNAEEGKEGLNVKVSDIVEQDDSLMCFQEHKDPVYSVAFSTDGAEVLGGDGDDKAFVWERSTGKVGAVPCGAVARSISSLSVSSA